MSIKALAVVIMADDALHDDFLGLGTDRLLEASYAVARTHIAIEAVERILAAIDRHELE